jgi:hypothetical protein
VMSLVEFPRSRQAVVFELGGLPVGSAGRSSGGGGRLFGELDGSCVWRVFVVGLLGRALELGPGWASGVSSASLRSRHRGLKLVLVLEFGRCGGGGGLWRSGGLGRSARGRENWGSLRVCC